MKVAHRPSRGLALIPALVCLVLVMLLGGVLLKQGGLQRKAARSSEDSVQAGWLAESGLGLARARLGQDPQYQGETWRVPAEALGGLDSGVVTIEVVAVEKQSGQRRINVKADYPESEPRRARRGKSLIITLQPKSPGGSS